MQESQILLPFSPLYEILKIVFEKYFLSPFDISIDKNKIKEITNLILLLNLEGQIILF